VTAVALKIVGPRSRGNPCGVNAAVRRDRQRLGGCFEGGGLIRLALKAYRHGATTPRSWFMPTPSVIDAIASATVECAFKVHRRLGPGLLESIYQRCLAFELRKAGIGYGCEVPLPIMYDDNDLGPAYKMDMVIEQAIIVENKAVLQILPIHQAQLLTYLKLTDYRLGFLINWNVILLKDGIKRVANRF
jgi:GxxExxY protein